MTGRETMLEPANRVARPINLRAWFVVFLLWMGGLAAAALWGLSATAAESRVGLAVWLLSLYAFYLSLCCAFFPAPTTWIVLLVASDFIAEQLGVHEHRAARVVVVATVGAFATGMANLNEYHLITFLLQYRGIARVRNTRLYRKAAEWFEINPFLTLVAISLIPIPIDVVRWLAIVDRYPRDRYFGAYFIGRWVRYAIWALTAMALALKTWHIAAIQAALVLAALAKIVPGIVRHVRGHEAGSAPIGNFAPRAISSAGSTER
jgi:membrane protein YqaA with SNARE-associated domain